LNPLNTFYFFYNDGFRAFVAMGTVVLAVTGAEALYADMGHFGRRPIKFSWLFFVLPALMLNYMGQGAMILSMTPQEAQLAIRDPFFLMVPDMISTPVIILTIMAAVIASQAVISGAFSEYSAHKRKSRRANLYSGDQLGSCHNGIVAGAFLPVIIKPGGGLRHRGDGRYVH
jgi:K+ transporter